MNTFRVLCFAVVGVWLATSLPLSAQEPKVPASQAPANRMTMTEDGIVRSVAFSPDGKTLASSGQGKTITLWDVQTCKERAALTEQTALVYSVAFSLDGKLLASVSSRYLAANRWLGTVKLWDVVKEESIEQDVRKMQGRWKIVAAEDEGQDATEELKAVKVVITGNKIVAHNGEKNPPEMIVRLRPDKRPKEFDFTLRAGGKAESLIGIYSLEDRDLKLCYNMVEGQPRPATFSTKAVDEVFISRSLVVLKREKP